MEQKAMTYETAAIVIFAIVLIGTVGAVLFVIEHSFPVPKKGGNRAQKTEFSRAEGEPLTRFGELPPSD